MQVAPDAERGPQRHATDPPDSPVELEIGAVANGGSCVARHDGRVVFVRHTLPGEVVLATVTGVGGGGRYWLADATTVLRTSPHRVQPPCPFSGPGGCGGCDYQHVALDEQRRWKAGVVAEQLLRLGGIDTDVPLDPVPGDAAGLQWRTRVRYAVAPDGRTGFRMHRSATVVPVEGCRIAAAAVQDAEVAGDRVSEHDWAGCDEVVVVSSADGVGVWQRPGPKPPEVRERAAGRDWSVAGDGFWQVHPGAADALADQVVQHCAGMAPVWDLYCGVGLFAGALAAAEPGRRIAAVEGDRRAVALARRNLAGLPGVRVHRRDVRAWTADPVGPTPEAVVLDPPRSGAGAQVVDRLTGSAASRLVYIACDPAALGRDAGRLREAGWRLNGVRALDIFPMTHHVEAVAVFDR